MRSYLKALSIMSFTCCFFVSSVLATLALMSISGSVIAGTQLNQSTVLTINSQVWGLAFSNIAFSVGLQQDSHGLPICPTAVHQSFTCTHDASDIVFASKPASPIVTAKSNNKDNYLSVKLDPAGLRQGDCPHSAGQGSDIDVDVEPYFNSAVDSSNATVRDTNLLNKKSSGVISLNWRIKFDRHNIRSAYAGTATCQVIITAHVINN